MSRTITVTSGKGGVGKTNIALNLAVSLAKAGKKVCLFDVDLGLANINILLGLYPETTLQDVLFEGRRPKDIMMRAVGIDILPGSSGIEEIANLDNGQLQRMVEQLSSLSDYDFVLFDTSAGIARNVLAFCLAASDLVMVITPEVTSLTDAYALLKVLVANGFQGTVRTVINNCKNPGEAKETYHKFKKVVDHYLSLPVQALGPVYQDRRVAEAVRQQNPFVELYPESIAARCLQKIAERLLSEKGDAVEKDYFVSFWQRCFALFSNPVKMPSAKDRGTSVAPEKKGEKFSPASLPAAPGKDPAGIEDHQPLVPAGAGEIWEVLVEAVLNISHELRQLRESIEKLQPGGKERAKNTPFPEEAENTSRIVLDLAGYLQKQQEEKRD